MTAKERFAARCAQMAANGCVDIKVSLLEDLTGATEESVCAELESIFDALEKGQYAALNFNDSRRAA